ncbi:MAG TPA: long-chain-fatty-acid--CoA ligase [Saprospirales bacterium]|nr:long-chain-fatty-acid--CoA ligase [Saprospirales bacterium]HCR53188.1 long-chain-fatty-acid--CoA ligase [Cytophagales bacterium]HRQ29179.1 AMP-binding protein [Saprospiraceae bacterium]
MTDSRPWLEQYPSGLPANIDTSQYPTLLSFLDEVFKKYKNQTAFINMDKSITYGEADEMSTHLAAYLHSRGLHPGDRIAIMMPNLLQSPIALFGAIKAGLIVVNTNPLYTPREMKHQFVDSEVKAIIIADMFAANLQKILKETEIETIILTSIGEMIGGLKGAIVDLVVRKVKKMVPSYSLDNTVKFKDAINAGKKFTIKPFLGNPDDVVFHQYTGGTTGVSKGAMLTNSNMVANLLQIKFIMMTMLEEKKEFVLTPLPLYHIFALTVNLFAMMSLGETIVLVTNARDLPSVIKEIKKYPISVFTGVNTLFKALLNNDEFKKLDFSKMKVVVGGGMAVQDVVANEWKKLTGVTLTEGYGLTETAPVASVNPIDGSARIGTIGMPVSSTYMRVVNEAGEPLAAGEVGEIVIKGPQVMKGYYKRPDETANSIKDGWLFTGDIGYMEPDGYFRIVDRKKDMILVSGFNVYPNDIEEVVAAHPKVMEVAAVGIPNEKSGEVVKLYITKKDKSLTESEVIAYCRENMTNYKVPKVVEFIDEMPKTNVGKILRRALRDRDKSQ